MIEFQIACTLHLKNLNGGNQPSPWMQTMKCHSTISVTGWYFLALGDDFFTCWSENTFLVTVHECFAISLQNFVKLLSHGQMELQTKTNLYFYSSSTKCFLFVVFLFFLVYIVADLPISVPTRSNTHGCHGSYQYIDITYFYCWMHLSVSFVLSQERVC